MPVLYGRTWLLENQLSYSSEGRRRKVCLLHIRSLTRSCKHVHSHNIGQNIAKWPHLATKDAGKCSLYFKNHLLSLKIRILVQGKKKKRMDTGCLVLAVSAIGAEHHWPWTSEKASWRRWFLSTECSMIRDSSRWKGRRKGGRGGGSMYEDIKERKHDTLEELKDTPSLWIIEWRQETHSPD